VLAGKVIVVTGGTGSFGRAFVKLTLDKYDVSKIVIFSRDEMKQWQMALDFEEYGEKVRFVLGDVRDKNRLQRCFRDADIVVHAAAQKIVTTAEYNPLECVKTNVDGAVNVIDAALDVGVESVVALSTDKACGPSNLYGATKLVSDKLFVAANSYSGRSRTKFSVVRYGNVAGSRGSFIPLFKEIAKQSNVFPLTDPRMTRFLITLDEGVGLVWLAIEQMNGGETFVKKIPSVKVVDVIKAIREDAQMKIIGVRPGEKLHEQMIASDDAINTLEFDDHFRIYPGIHPWINKIYYPDEGKHVPEGFEYKSDKNENFLSTSDLRSWLRLNSDY
jgi:UDP-N-acetylglucosamine 4,6-dehydratase